MAVFVSRVNDVFVAEPIVEFCYMICLGLSATKYELYSTP
jgi:hypothetical protein